MVLANILYDTDENYNLASTFSCWNEVDLPLVWLAASLCSCGRCLHVYSIIKFPHAIIRNNARGRVRSLLRIALELKQLWRYGFLRCMQLALRFRTIMRNAIFWIFAAKVYIPFPRAGHNYQFPYLLWGKGPALHADMQTFQITHTHCVVMTKRVHGQNFYLWHRVSFGAKFS